MFVTKEKCHWGGVVSLWQGSVLTRQVSLESLECVVTCTCAQLRVTRGATLAQMERKQRAS